MRKNSRRGFTLIELIITISILAVLIAILVVTLNPAEQLARARDTKRVADLDAMKTGVNLYLAQATGTVNLTSDTTANNRCIGGAGTVTFFMNSVPATATIPTNFTATVTSTGQLVSTSTSYVNGSTWMPVLLGNTPGGTPLAVLPLDPTNGTGVSTSSFYGYGCRSSNKTFEFTARLESTYFTSDLDLDGTDGGNSTSTYEVGTDLTIIPSGS